MVNSITKTQAEDGNHIERYAARNTAWPTVFISLFFILGVPTNLILTTRGVWPLWVGFLIGIVLYNFGFTIWHEAAHGNIVPKNRTLNDLFGILGSIANILPAFFRQRHDHLLHHNHLMDIEYDRTVYRARGPYWHVLLSILEEVRTYKPYSIK
ncbi:MAG: fatty acid desaturase, partial [Candidatus Paceibacterales bacterium]